MTRILGISAFYHDSAAALVEDGRIAAAAQEERFSRRKHDARFPAQALSWCLDEAGTALSGIDHVVFYDKPLVKFERLLETYLAFAPRGLASFVRAMPVWLKEKLYLKALLQRELAALAGGADAPRPPLLFTAHHEAHAAAAFYPSPFAEAAILCLDGVGEWATTSVWTGRGNRIAPHWEIDFPHSLGLLYSAFTYYCGFRVNSGEYKLMGLAPYGEPRYAQRIREHLIDVKPDGTFRLDMRYFDFATGLRMTNARFDALFEGPARTAESELTQRHMDVARSIQDVTEDIVLRLARTVAAETGMRRLCLAGGVALNCVANGRLLRDGPFDDLWIQPAAGDAGSAVGAALAAWHGHLGHERTPVLPDAMAGSYLGPAFGPDAIRAQLDAAGAVYDERDDATLVAETAAALAAGEVVGWFQGRMEFGPRALGNRSILGDPRNPGMQRTMNLKIKYRESFRPFAPSVLETHVGDYFELDRASPYMLLVAPVRRELRIADPGDATAFGIAKLNQPRSTLPAITHVDHSARIQTVTAAGNPRYHALIEAFRARTGCAALINTSFNVRGEPIVRTPEEAFRCFMRTEMDRLVVGNFVMRKAAQAPVAKDESWQAEFALD
ncbi:MAG: carbamoyltransferase [Betaproteobacteria bacterium]|nr:carbamoyltransferase [Betaproteobacteria bacterium]